MRFVSHSLLLLILSSFKELNTLKDEGLYGIYPCNSSKTFITQEEMISRGEEK
jgi:hypothetical protein